MRTRKNVFPTSKPACSGWTLLELAICAVIISLMVMIAMPNYARALERSKCVQGLHQVKTLRNAAIMYHRENQTFAGMTIAVLGTLVGETFSDTNDWTLAVAAGVDTFTVTATRLNGNWATSSIVVNELDDYSASSYPFDDPGGW